MAIKDFNPEKCDAAYTMGIVDLLLECVELSHRSGNLFPIGTWILKFSVSVLVELLVSTLISLYVELRQFGKDLFVNHLTFLLLILNM